MGSLSGVVITPEVFLTCTTHALSTEAEEVMGLLLGDIRDANGERVAHIRRAVPQIRTDRRKDRVETSPEQMAAASALAEHISTSTGVATRVVGWYHSHPHITVLPSHVDVTTQAMYQLLDAGFVGLIWSVFNTAPASKGQTIQVTAFQSLPAQPSSGLELLPSADLDGLDAQTKAALRASAADMHETGSSGWQRKEVALHISSSSSSDGSNPATLSDYVDVQRMLLAEEQQAHGQRSSSGAGVPASDAHVALLQLRDAALHQGGLIQHAECVLAPALAAMQQLYAQAGLQARQLADDNARLEKLLAAAQQHSGAAEPSPLISLDTATTAELNSSDLLDGC